MDKIIENIKDIALKYHGISKILLFGSRARGDFNEKSDYDIAIVAPNMLNRDKNCFTDELEEINTLHKIDVVFLEQLKGEQNEKA